MDAKNKRRLKTFKVGELIMAQLRKEKTLIRTYSKL